MEVQLAVLADAANVAAGRKLNILGIFDTLWFQDFPTAYPMMAFVMRLRLERAGVPRSVAMKLVGHKTEAMYRRYAIVSQRDLTEAVAKLATMRDGAGSLKRAAQGFGHNVGHNRAQTGLQVAAG